MSKITYCSLEEAWGNSFNRNQQNTVKNSQENTDMNQRFNKKENTLYDSQEKSLQNLPQNTLQIQQQNNQKIYDRNKYNKLIEDSEENRTELINNMNKIERNYLSENNNQTSLVEYNKYRINPKNQVKEYYEPQYTPFQDNIDKKYLQDKLSYLENEFIKYKSLMNNNIEHFDNSTSENTNNNINKDNDMIDLIVLIIIGLLVIFVLNSIFNIGKALGARNK